MVADRGLCELEYEETSILATHGNFTSRYELLLAYSS